MRNFLLCAALFCLAACTQQGWIDRLASSQEQREALDTAQELRNGEVAKLAARIEPQLKQGLPNAAAQVRPILAAAQGPFKIQTVNVLELSGGPVTKAFTLQTGSGSHWAMAEIVLRGTPGSLQVAGFHIWPVNSDPSKLNDFHLNQRGVVGYIWILMMLTCAALCIAAVVLIWRRPWLERRWLWTVGSLLGFAGFGLNWSTGAWAILFINISLLGAQASKAGPFAPWILSFGIPIVAIIVIARWVRRARTEAEAGEVY